MRNESDKKGFTLLEMLLVLAIMSSIIVMVAGLIQQKGESNRRARVTMQMQQILNAGLSFYIANSSWPTWTNLTTAPAYLPSTVTNPWGLGFTVGSTTQYFFVCTVMNGVGKNTAAKVVAGALPIAYVSADCTKGTGGIPPAPSTAATASAVVSQVNIPGQNLNNATSVNFTGLYHNGACVPYPTCPVDKNGTTMTPQIMVIPVAMYGMYDEPIGCTIDSSTGIGSCNGVKLSPISGYTAYAKDADSTATTGDKAGFPPLCTSTGTAAGYCYTGATLAKIVPTTPTPTKYWRVCLDMISQKGPINPSRGSTDPITKSWGQMSGTVLAITRCVPANESTGSSLNVWTN